MGWELRLLEALSSLILPDLQALGRILTAVCIHSVSLFVTISY